MLRQRAASKELNQDDMWMTSFVDRYKNRPEDNVFGDVCLGTFASEYRVLSKSERSQNPIKLKNNCGFVTKRIGTQPAVVVYGFLKQKIRNCFIKVSYSCFYLIATISS